MSKKITCGGFYIDNATLKLMPDGKTLFVAGDVKGNLTDDGVKAMLGNYAEAHDGVHTGTTHMQSIVADEEITAHTIHAPVIMQGNTDLLHEIQNNQIAIRELQAVNGNDICVVHMYSVYSPDGDSVIGMQSSMSVEQLAPYIKKNKIVMAHNSDNHTMTPMFIYNYDMDNSKKITAIYWYQQDVVYNKMLMYKQTDTDVVEFQSNGK